MSVGSVENTYFVKKSTTLTLNKQLDRSLFDIRSWVFMVVSRTKIKRHRIKSDRKEKRMAEVWEDVYVRRFHYSLCWQGSGCNVTIGVFCLIYHRQKVHGPAHPSSTLVQRMKKRNIFNGGSSLSREKNRSDRVNG